MLAIPAIDIKDGKVVRLLQGKYTEVTVYSHDPLETAKSWQKQGAHRLHIVDLDGALSGQMKNNFAVRQIIEGVDIAVQFGGGLRTREDIDSILSIGAKWAIIGTKACEDFDFIKDAVADFGEQIIVSIDVKFKKVVARGWTQTSELEDTELIKKLRDLGVKSFIYTDISRDGTLAGINTEGIKKVLQDTGATMFYSGGISTLVDVENLSRLEHLGLVGVIIGKAFYEDKFHFVQVQRILEEKK